MFFLPAMSKVLTTQATSKDFFFLSNTFQKIHILKRSTKSLWTINNNQ